MNFLFWNIKRKKLYENIINLTIKHHIDVLVLAESDSINSGILETLLNQKSSSSGNDYQFLHSIVKNPTIKIFIRFPNSFTKPVFDNDSGRITIKHLDPPLNIPLILVVVHMRSKLYRQESSQSFAFLDLIEKVEDAEERYKHYNTIIVGDLNVNPFEIALVNAKGLHSVSSKDVALQFKRRIESKEYKFFYNPMWNLFGDKNSKPPGTYYYNNSDFVNYFWNIFDQVLIRPNLLDRFNINSLKILDSDGKHKLVTLNGRPDKENFSDHLPIKFSLDMKSESGD